MKLLVVGNPIAGGGRARGMIERLDGLLRERGHAVEVFLSEKAGDAGERAGRLDLDVERLVVVGGDGTLNEVLNGLHDPGRVPLVQLPAGTANILAHELELPFEPEGTAALVDDGRVRHVDMGLVGERRFLLVVSSGFDAMVTEEIRKRRSGSLGYLGYVRPIFRALRHYVPHTLRVQIDGRDPVECQLVVASNTRNYGGLFSVVDEARCDSGHLEILMWPRASTAQLFRILGRAYWRGFSGASNVVHQRGQRVRIESDEPVAVEVDGDYIGTTPVAFGLEPRRVPVVVPF